MLQSPYRFELLEQRRLLTGNVLDLSVALSGPTHAVAGQPIELRLSTVNAGPGFSDRTEVRTNFLQQLDDVDVQYHGRGYSWPTIAVNTAPNVGTTVSEQTAGFFGGLNRGIGDFNGDGFDDFVIADHPKGQPGSPRSLFVVFGSDAPSLDLNALDGENGFVLQVPLFRALRSTAVTGADINGDGFDDLIIGIPAIESELASHEAGVHVIFGAPRTAPELTLFNFAPDTGMVLRADSDDGHFGSAVHGLGDFNGDGWDDLAIGASPPHRDAVGRVYLVYGNTDYSPSTSRTDLTALPETTVIQGKQVGGMLAAVHDVNGDGLNDLAMTASFPVDGSISDSMTVLVLFGATDLTGRRLQANSIGGQHSPPGLRFTPLTYHSNITAAGDFDGDGFADILVGYDALADEVDRATGYVVYGGPDLPSVLGQGQSQGMREFTTIPLPPLISWSVAGGVDVNGDNLDDLLLGARGTEAGVTAVLGRGDRPEIIDLDSGPPGAGISGKLSAGTFEVGGDGASVATNVGDVDGDGNDDILLTQYVYASVFQDPSLAIHQANLVFGGTVQGDWVRPWTPDSGEHAHYTVSATVPERATGLLSIESSILPAARDTDVAPSNNWDSHHIRIVSPTADTNRDNQISTADIDTISAAVRSGHTTPALDLTDDGRVDATDRAFLLDLLAVDEGDANMDGQIGFDDFLLLADNFQQHGGWGEGDFDGDGQIDMSDFQLLAGRFGFAPRRKGASQ